MFVSCLLVLQYRLALGFEAQEVSKVSVIEGSYYQMADAAHEDAGAHVVEPDLDDVESNPDLENLIDKVKKCFHS